MAIYHLSARPPIARSAGRSATAAAAYRSAALILDTRTGITFDFRRKRGVSRACLQLPTGARIADRAAFWNGIERHHRRGDAVVAREVVVALPAELAEDERTELALSFALEIANEFGVAVDCALHDPSRDGDDRNFHAHLLLSACSVSPDGSLGKKSERLDPIACKRARVPDSVSWLRPRWEALVNAALADGGLSERVDHRSHRARGLTAHPSIHVGKKASAVRVRGARNIELRKKNASAAALELRIAMLTRMRVRLENSQADGATHRRASSIERPAAECFESSLRGASRRDPRSAEGDEVPLLPWKRRRVQPETAPYLGSPEVVLAAETSPSKEARRVVRRRP